MHYFGYYQDGVIVSAMKSTHSIAAPSFIPISKEEYDTFTSNLPPIEEKSLIQEIEERFQKIESALNTRN